ncbi:hypothetical protein B8W69_24050 [Mycobacterium vulneris]|uniref:Uncharacterized protein n=1 Tax=Mycolicibacterium vulneris TaxID=547163 RepID=A0A1X2KNL4_9MYCO|nr:hypothetical protein B8W69_24050 [Mycolicibacterium vulneris]
MLAGSRCAEAVTWQSACQGGRAEQSQRGAVRWNAENSNHGARDDDALKEELEGTVHGNRSSRSEEWRDPEPPADDDPDVRTAGPAPRES